MIEVFDPAETKPLAEIKYFDFGIAVEHNYPCTVCRENTAVLTMWNGIMQPCWSCQAKGYEVVKKRPFGFRRLN